MEHAHELLAIECVNALFWNYTREDIQALKASYRDFDHVWNTYIADKSGQDAFNALWDCWMLKFNVATKHGIIEYALDKYREEKMEALDGAHRMTAFWKRIENGD